MKTETIIANLNTLITDIEAHIDSNNLHLVGLLTLPYFMKLAQAVADESLDDILLRGFKDNHTYTAIHYEDAPYLNTLSMLKVLLSEAYPHFNKLPLLGMEFNTILLDLNGFKQRPIITLLDIFGPFTLKNPYGGKGIETLGEVKLDTIILRIQVHEQLEHNTSNESTYRKFKP